MRRLIRKLAEGLYADALKAQAGGAAEPAEGRAPAINTLARPPRRSHANAPAHDITEATET